MLNISFFDFLDGAFASYLLIFSEYIILWWTQNIFILLKYLRYSVNFLLPRTFQRTTQVKRIMNSVHISDPDGNTEMSEVL
jgi:hypothetical protein